MPLCECFNWANPECSRLQIAGESEFFVFPLIQHALIGMGPRDGELDTTRAHINLGSPSLFKGSARHQLRWLHKENFHHMGMNLNYGPFGGHHLARGFASNHFSGAAPLQFIAIFSGFWLGPVGSLAAGCGVRSVGHLIPPYPDSPVRDRRPPTTFGRR